MGKEKQKIVLNEMVLNGGNLERAVKEAKDPKTGDKIYSARYARSGKIVKTKTWQELMEKELPDDDLLKVNKEGLIATFEKPIIVGRDEKGKPEYEYIEKPDFNARHKYLETAYKIKGKIKDSPIISTQTNIQVNFFSNPKIQEATRIYEQALKEQIRNENKEPVEILQDKQELGNN